MEREWAGVLLAVAVLAPGVAGADDRDPTPDPAALRTLEVRGFSVDTAADARLYWAYRNPGKDPVYVSSDAGISLYLSLLRRGLEEAVYAGDADLSRDAASWDASVRALAPGEEGRPARFFTAVLAALAGAPGPLPDEDVRAAVEVQVARALGKSPPLQRAECLGTDLDEGFLAALLRNAPTDEVARHDGAVLWLTRVRFPPSPSGNAARRVLAETLPAGLRDRVLRHFEWAGISRLRFPGQKGVFDIEVPGDLRFPPGTLPGHAEVVGLDFGRRLQSRLARDLLAGDPFGKEIRPADGGPAPGSLAAGFEDLLARTLRPADPRAPEFYRTLAWEALSLQSALAADALFRRAFGPVQEPTRVFGADGTPGFVHPDPGFWEALASLAGRLAKDLPASPRPGLPAKDRILAAVESLKTCLKEWKPLPVEHVRTLRRCRLGGWMMDNVETVGSGKVSPEERRLVVGWLKKGVEDTLREENLQQQAAEPPSGEVPPSVARRRPRGMLERLAETSVKFARVAESQLRGEDPEGLPALIMEFGFLCEDVEMYQAGASPFSGCVVVLDDPPHRLVHGSAGLRFLWVLHPWKGAMVRARGVVFGYREWVGKEWPDDARWREIHGTVAPPSWAAAALAPVPAETK